MFTYIQEINGYLWFSARGQSLYYIAKLFEVDSDLIRSRLITNKYGQSLMIKLLNTNEEQFTIGKRYHLHLDEKNLNIHFSVKEGEFFAPCFRPELQMIKHSTWKELLNTETAPDMPDDVDEYADEADELYLDEADDVNDTDNTDALNDYQSDGYPDYIDNPDDMLDDMLDDIQNEKDVTRTVYINQTTEPVRHQKQEK